MPTQFGVPNLIVTRGTAPAPSRRPSTAPSKTIEHNLHVTPNMGYTQSRGGWSAQGGYRGMDYKVQPPPKPLYENPLSGTGEPTLIPANSLSGRPKGVIKLAPEEYERIKMTPYTKHPIFDIPNNDALSLYQ